MWITLHRQPPGILCPATGPGGRIVHRAAAVDHRVAAPSPSAAGSPRAMRHLQVAQRDAGGYTGADGPHVQRRGVGGHLRIDLLPGHRAEPRLPMVQRARGDVVHCGGVCVCHYVCSYRSGVDGGCGLVYEEVVGPCLRGGSRRQNRD